MDGEGSFLIAKQTGLPLMEVSNTDHRMTDRCQEIAGGTIHCYAAKRGFRRPVWKWELFGFSSIPWARRLIPLLVTKSRHAAIVAAMPTVSYKGRSVPRRVRYLREEAAKMLRPLNHRGTGELN